MPSVFLKSDLQPVQNVSCLIHNTEVCVQYMSNFTKAAEISLKSEEEAKFSVSISPYTAQVYINPETWNFSAINISFAIHKEGVDSLAIKIKHNNTPPICRIFDFRNQRFFTLPVSFFYDCLYNLAEPKLQMDTISLPSNEHLSYYVYIPYVITKRTPCDWQPVIMVFSGSLVEGVVKVKFSPPPSEYNISFCTVELVASSSYETISNVVSSNKTEDMLVTEFVSVSFGNYTVIVKPHLENCRGTKTGYFPVGDSKLVLDIVTGICICIIIVFIICSFAIYRFCNISHKLSLTVKQALLVYSYDNQKHEEFVTALVEFLNQTSYLKVSTIYGSTVDMSASKIAMNYLIEESNKADLIMFLISQGLLLTLNDNCQIGIGHKWPLQLENASSYILDELYYNKAFRQKKICKILFPYAKKLDIPDYIEKRRTVRCFSLPEDLNHFMCFVHGEQTTIFRSVLCPPLTVDFNSSEVGKKQLETMLKDVPVADKNKDVVWFPPKEITEDFELQKSNKENSAESDNEANYDSVSEGESTESGSMTKIENFEGNSEDVSSEGEDQPLFYSNITYIQ